MIRRAELKDVESIAMVITNAWKTSYKGIIDQNYADNIKIDKYIKIFTKNIDEEKEIIFGNQDKVVNGFVSGLNITGKYDCEIIGLYVHPENQRQGIGRKLIKIMIDYFKEAKRKDLLIWTLNGAKNNTFYEHMGGVKQEYKELDIGEKKYTGVGFHIQI